MLKKTRRSLISLLFMAVLFLCGCSKGTSTTPQPTSPDEKVATGSPSPVSKPPASRAPGGDAIDTSQLDADVAKAEETRNANSSDENSRMTLAHAYLARANALTKARQYRSALGDFRRTLKLDPQNKEAVDMSGTIISILKSMGREIPPEGQEPPPLPFDKNKGAESGKESSY